MKTPHLYMHMEKAKFSMAMLVYPRVLDVAAGIVNNLDTVRMITEPLAVSCLLDEYGAFQAIFQVPLCHQLSASLKATGPYNLVDTWRHADTCTPSVFTPSPMADRPTCFFVCNHLKTLGLPGLLETDCAWMIPEAYEEGLCTRWPLPVISRVVSPFVGAPFHPSETHLLLAIYISAPYNNSICNDPFRGAYRVVN